MFKLQMEPTVWKISIIFADDCSEQILREFHFDEIQCFVYIIASKCIICLRGGFRGQTTA